MIILSFHCGHDASVCLYEDGDVKKYFLVERFTKIKHDHNFLSIINFVFDNINEKIDCLSFSTFNHKIDTTNIFFSKVFNHYKSYNPNLILNFNSNHHLNHASLAFHNSEFGKSLVIVVDGSGSIIKNNLVEVESVFLFTHKENTLLYKNTVESFSSWDLPWGKVGVGGLYDMASILIGNTPDDCGKAMGLSSYGSSNKTFKNLLSQQNSVIEPIKKIEPDNYQSHADFCYEVQQQTQREVGDLIEDSITKTGVKKVCISGGYGMNIVANHYYLQRFPDVEFYFEPLCNDSGCSIGSAILSYTQLTKNKHNPIKTTSFHGLKYDVSLQKGVFKSIKEIAKLLYENKSVAIYTGLAESGQRALGNRSIFFNALNPSAKDIVNMIKKREWYRPFAAVVLEEDAKLYFDMGRIKSNQFMTICFPVNPEYIKIIPGITHVDNTCRIQTISEEHTYMYELLQEFKKLSGHGILLNTSFNLAGEPLVETSEDALNTLNNSCLDYLWFEETNQLIKNPKYNFEYV